MSLFFKNKTPTSSKSVIKSNKNMKPHSPLQRLARIKDLSLKREARQTINKIAHKGIFQTKKQIKEYNLTEKFKKLNIRQKKNVKDYIGIARD